jgi:phage baseplate assembly protein W
MVDTIDIFCTDDFLPTMPTVSGRTATKQRISRRLSTRRGVMPQRPDFGLDVRDYLLSDATEEQIARDVAFEIEKDEQVRSVAVTATREADAIALTLGLSDDDGAFEFTLSISEAAIRIVGAQ